MDEVREATESLLEEKPSIESGLRSVLEVDADGGAWDFEDIPLDSGEFGEVVSRGIVEQADEGYRLADRKAVAAVLGDQSVERSAEASHGGWIREKDVGEAISDRIDKLHWPTAAGLVGSLLLLTVLRLVPYRSVFRDGSIVLSSNDPYFYRYWTLELAKRAQNPLDVGILAEFPSKVATGEPLFVAVLWFASAVAGGDARAVGTVMAWYPVIAAVVGGLFVYLTAKRVSGDSRVGIASVSILAVVPAHGLRTGIGFADHHAFDYVWLGLGLLAVVVLADRRTSDRWTSAAGGVLGVAVAGQTLAWDNGPLLLVPLAVYASAVLTSELGSRSDSRFPVWKFCGGLLLAALMVGAVHLTFGWHSTLVAAVPGLMLLGTLGLVGLRSVVLRFDSSVQGYISLQGVVAVVGAIVTLVAVPGLPERLEQGLSVLFGATNVVEATSILGDPFGPFLGPILLTGFALFLIVPYLGWMTVRVYRSLDPVWLAPAVYSWYFLALSVLQVRFLGEFTVVASVFAGVGFVHLASWVDLARPLGFRSDDADSNGPSKEAPTAGEPEAERPELPSRRDALNLAGLWIGVSSLGLLLTPLKHSQVTIDDDLYEAATWMRQDAEERGLGFPDNYVFSHWSRNRVLNYFVNGQSESYGYARSNFPEFAAGSPEDAAEWYQRIHHRVGYVVVRDRESPPTSIHGSLRRYGSAGDGASGIGYFRAVYESPGESATVFTPVPGVILTGNGPSGGSAVGTLRQDVQIEGAQFEYRRTVQTNEFGIYETSVQYPGEYEFADETIRVSESDVREGRIITDFDAPGVVYWSFDEGQGDVAYDRAGGHHLRGVDGRWTDGQSGTAISFASDDSGLQASRVALGLSTRDSLTVSFSVRGNLADASQQYPRLLEYSASDSGFRVIARNQVEDFGILLDDVDGERVKNFGIEQRRFEEWTRVTAVLDREAGALDLYRDGSRVASTDVGEFGRIAGPGTIVVGPSGDHPEVQLDEIRIRKGAHPPS